MCCYLCRARPQRPQAERCVTHIQQTWKCCSLPSLTEGKSTQRARLFHLSCSSCADSLYKYRAPQCFARSRKRAMIFPEATTCFMNENFDSGHLFGAKGSFLGYVAMYGTLLFQSWHLNHPKYCSGPTSLGWDLLDPVFARDELSIKERIWHHSLL